MITNCALRVAQRPGGEPWSQHSSVAGTRGLRVKPSRGWSSTRLEKIFRGRVALPIYDGTMLLFGQPPFHLVGLSGGKDSTALALALREKEPDTRFCFYCTPTGDELPEVIVWWQRLEALLKSKIIPIMHTSLLDSIERNKTLPNFRRRFCTREIKIEPVIRVMRYLVTVGEVHSYIGLRADEEGRAGGAFDAVLGVTVHFPLRDWGWTISDVWRYLECRGMAGEIPARTDCALCFHQRVGEWWRLWRDHPERFKQGIELENKYGGTFRSPGRDTWPIALEAMANEFARGKVPTDSNQMELFSRPTMTGSCRVCSL